MGRKTKISFILIIMLIMCMLSGAWILKYVKEAARQRDETLEQIAAEVTSPSDIPGAVSEEVLEKWMTAEPVYSHRGSAGPNEHSFEAYDAAIKAGSHNIEQDIVISKDGTLYVAHDLSAAPMTGVGKLYSNMTDAEIDSLKTKAGANVLKLSDVFEKYGDSVHYLVELKSEDDATIEAFKKEVDDHGVEKLVIAQALDTAVLDKLEGIYPEMPKLLVVKTPAALRQAMESENVDMVGARVQFVTEANCKEAHERGKKFVGWPLDSEYEIKHAIDIGTDAYFTNNTERALKLEKKYRPFKISDHSTILFASDYQAQRGFDEPRETLAKLLKSVSADGIEADAAVFCGDYTNDRVLHDYQLSPEDSIAEIRSTIRENAPYVRADKMLFVQGNHDKMTESISTTGLHEYKNYLVYVLNTEEDYPWKQGKVPGCYDKVKAASEEMQKCFAELIEKGESRPVFIAGHVPLHYTARTSSKHSTGDNLYSSLIFDAVNEAAESLDIIYMYGHNHSKGWDCYMGGASVFKPKGETLLLPVFKEDAANTDTYEEKKLNFTYMNAGYTGYYINCDPAQDRAEFKAADEALTCTVCDIYNDRIEIRRYDEKGMHLLGADGEANPYKGGIDSGLIDGKYYSKKNDSPAVIKRMNAETAGTDANTEEEKEAA